MLLSPVFRARKVCLNTVSSLGHHPHLRSSLPEGAKHADGSQGFKKREDATTEYRSGGNTLMNNKLLEPGKTFWGGIARCLHVLPL